MTVRQFAVKAIRLIMANSREAANLTNSSDTTSPGSEFFTTHAAHTRPVPRPILCSQAAMFSSLANDDLHLPTCDLTHAQDHQVELLLHNWAFCMNLLFNTYGLRCCNFIAANCLAHLSLALFSAFVIMVFRCSNGTPLVFLGCCTCDITSL